MSVQISKGRKVLILEWMVGGGQWLDHRSQNLVSTAAAQADLDNEFFYSVLADEGANMLSAVVEDFARCGCHVMTVLDARFDGASIEAEKIKVGSAEAFERECFDLANQADLVLLIAPESQGRLKHLGQLLASFSDKWLSPNLAFLELASSKTETLRQLERGGVRVPRGNCLSEWILNPELYQHGWVLKPDLGAGSEGVFGGLEQASDLGGNASRLSVVDSKVRRHLETVGHVDDLPALRDWRIEEWVTGHAASISVIGDSTKTPAFLCPPTFQIFEGGMGAAWVQCERIFEPDLVRRASQVATKVMAAIPVFQGYIGIDFLYGTREEEDTVLEINPRLTSSYLKIREMIDGNLAETMIGAFDH